MESLRLELKPRVHRSGKAYHLPQLGEETEHGIVMGYLLRMDDDVQVVEGNKAKQLMGLASIGIVTISDIVGIIADNGTTHRPVLFAHLDEDLFLSPIKEEEE